MEALVHYLQIVALGIIEGVTEFLPISSTGHLLIAEGLGLGNEPDVFNVVIQAGAILAVVFIYWNKIVGLLTHLENPAGRAYLMKIGLAFLITGFLGAILVHFKLKLPETLTPVAWATLIGAFVIFAVEFLAKNLYPHDDISWGEAVAMGLAQIVAAVFPGASRSGSTIMAGLLMGVKRPAATEFSFLVGIPTMFAASGVDLIRYRKDLLEGGGHLFIDVLIGFLVSMVVAFFVVKWLLHFVRSHTFNGFAVYRVILGAGLLIALATHALPNLGESEKTRPVAKAAAKEAVPTLAPAAAPTTNHNAAVMPVTPGTLTTTNAAPASGSMPVDNTEAATNAAPVTNVPASQ